MSSVFWVVRRGGASGGSTFVSSKGRRGGGSGALKGRPTGNRNWGGKPSKNSPRHLRKIGQGKGPVLERWAAQPTGQGGRLMGSSRTQTTPAGIDNGGTNLFRLREKGTGLEHRLEAHGVKENLSLGRSNDSWEIRGNVGGPPAPIGPKSNGVPAERGMKVGGRSCRGGPPSGGKWLQRRDHKRDISQGRGWGKIYHEGWALANGKEMHRR